MTISGVVRLDSFGVEEAGFGRERVPTYPFGQTPLHDRKFVPGTGRRCDATVAKAHAKDRAEPPDMSRRRTNLHCRIRA
jgi:hypothetical protein